MTPASNPDVWGRIKSQLKTQMTSATYSQWIDPTTGALDGDTLTLHAPTPQAQEWLEGRLLKPIAQAAAAADVGITKIDVVLNGTTPAPPPEPDDGPLEISGRYTQEYTETVNPEQVEVFTQYFRRVWRPRLGPLLSELVRELRQRCYYGRGQDQTRRNTCEVTQPELARCLGVSASTLKRALRRDDTGKFKNAHLNLFIIDMETVTRYDEDKKRVVNDRTRFVVALDEPILSKCQNDP